MTRPGVSRVAWLLPPFAALCAVALLLADPAPLQALRNGVFDQYQRWFPRPYQASPVRIVDIDEESLRRLGQWPWPRTRLAELIDRLSAAGVAAIGLDLILAEGDRTSPVAAAGAWAVTPELRRALAALPDHDRVLARSIAGAPVVLGFAVDHRVAERGAATLPERPYRYVEAGAPAGRWLHSFATATLALPLFERVARGNGALSFVADTDGVVRRVPLALAIDGQPVSTLVAELLRIAAGQRNIVLRSAGNDSGLAGIGIGQRTIPTNAHGEMWLHYSLPRAERYLPAWRLFAEQGGAAQLAGQVVLLGSSAQGLMDLRFNALGRVVPGVEVHAQALEQVLGQTYLRRPAWAVAAEAIVTAAMTLLVGAVALRARALAAAAVGALLLVALNGGAWLAFRHAGLLLDSVAPTLAGALTFVAASLVHHRLSERRQRWIRAAFSRYVSPNRVAHLLEHPEEMALGGRRQECSFVFTDLAGFTRLMEKTDPADAVARLNAYLDGMIGIAFAHQGTLDRIVGDAVAIMFSAPLRQDDHCARALACALEMDRFARDYAAGLGARGIEFCATRIGIHSGTVIVGNFGGSTIFDYRALGDAVNTAARLEHANKVLGTTLCLSQQTLDGCPPDTPVRPIGRLLLSGKSAPLQVYEPLSAAGGAYAPNAQYASAYALLAQAQCEAARTAFADLAERYPDDPLVALHCRRLQTGAGDDLVVIAGK